MTDSSKSPCASCGACCRSYIVPLCGRDVWQISREQQLAPESFVRVVASPGGRDDGFVLEAGGPTYFLCLDKQGKFEIEKSCVFLMHLAGGQDRCGIYAHRPVVCQAYPMVLAGRGVALKERALCPPDAWPAEDFAKQSWRRAVHRSEMHFQLYCEAVARWNARVAAAPAGRVFSSSAYYSFLYNLYEYVASLDQTLDSVTHARIELTWGYLPSESPGAPPIDLPWLGYLETFREIVASF